jgi:hypothetical protein
LKQLVDQYRGQMEEYVKITQKNQDMMGRINIEGNINHVKIDTMGGDNNENSTEEEPAEGKRRKR